MDSSSTMMIVALAILVLLSAYFSATETAFTSINRIRLKNLAASGNKRADLVLQLSENYDKLLSTILIGNNIVNITSASLATVLFVGYFGDMGVTLSTIIMTIVVLIFGEISPKSIAKDAPESFAMFSAPILKGCLILLTPLNFVFMQWKKLLSKVFRVKEDRTITDEELITIVEEAQQEGGLDESESNLIKNAIEFNDLEVSDILTPRVDISAVDKEDSVEEIETLFLESGFSRLPVYEESVDNIIGIILNKDFHNYVIHQGKPLASIIKPTIYVPESTKISSLLTMLQQSKSHLAVVTDEFGGTFGIVTMEDILEELVGEIWDEHDEVVEEIVQTGENQYRVVCTANVQKLFDFFHIDCNEEHATAVSGWVIEEMGKIPNEGESFTYDNLEITVTKKDYRRILEISVRVLEIGQEAVNA